MKFILITCCSAFLAETTILARNIVPTSKDPVPEDLVSKLDNGPTNENEVEPFMWVDGILAPYSWWRLDEVYSDEYDEKRGDMSYIS